MTARRMLGAALLAVWAGWSVPTVRCQVKDTRNMDETARMQPTTARLAVWTDKPAYYARELISAYMALDPGKDPAQYHWFLYLEHLDTGQRRYMVPYRSGSGWQFVDGVADSSGRKPVVRGAARPPAWPPGRIWAGRGLEPGRWQFVTELRSPDTTETVKRAHAKFVVSAWLPRVFGEGGHDTEISEDATWTSEWIWAVRGSIFVQPGATLAIEPGTVVVGRGAQAVIVVERGGRVGGRGRPDAPVVMTCDAPAGQRLPGCWGGLAVLGKAPLSRGTRQATGVEPAARAVYGGADSGDASGVLNYVRIEFAGAVAGDGAKRPGVGLYGVGAGTRISHLQVHASAGAGILFSGGTVGCTFCVSSAAGGDALAWELGWRGTAQHVFLHQDPAAEGCGIDGANDDLAFDALPRSAPVLFNLTLAGGSPSGQSAQSTPCGIQLRGGSAITARNVIVLGYPSGAISLRDNAESLFLDGTSSIADTILHPGTASSGDRFDAVVAYRDVNPMLVTAADQPNPDLRPRLDSPALKVGAGAVPPSDGLLDTSAQYIGAFGDSNWLEEWTFFGRESDYSLPEPATGGEGN